MTEDQAGSWRGRRAVRRGLGAMALVLGMSFLLSCGDAPTAPQTGLGVSRAVKVAVGDFVVNGSLRKPDGTPFGGAAIDALASGTTTVVASATTAADGQYAMSLAAGTYDFRITPSAGSGFRTSVVPQVVVSANKTLDFVLVPAGSALLSGRVLDGEGVGVPGVNMYLTPTDGGAERYVLTDADGRYAVTLSPGSYGIRIDGYGAGATPSMFYLVASTPLTLTGDMVFDLPLPVHRVDVHVQDPGGVPVAGAWLTTGDSYNSGLTAGGLQWQGYSRYPAWRNVAGTDASGNGTLWLFSSPANAGYTITATPPAQSGYGPASVADVAVTENRTLTIALVKAAQLSGRVLDGEGVGVPGVNMYLTPADGGAERYVLTDADGRYSTALSPGSYGIRIDGYGAGATPSMFYLVATTPLVVTGDLVFDLPLPVHRVDVHVQDPGGVPVAGAWLTTGDSYNSGLTAGGLQWQGYSRYPAWRNVAGTDASGNGTLWLFSSPANAGYTITATPPAQSGYGPASVADVAVTENRTLTVALVKAAQLSGRVLDGEGVGVPNVNMYLTPADGGAERYLLTDADGRYAVALGPGSYGIRIDGYGAGATPSMFYLVATTPLTLTGDMLLDLTLPTHRVDVHVQDPGGVPVAGVWLSTGLLYTSGLTAGGLQWQGYSQYPTWRNVAGTDASGNGTLWLFSSPANAGYTITASPPAGLPFGPLSIPDVAVAGAMTKAIILQYEHAPPITTIGLSPSPEAGGKYASPVTVTLSAAAAAGYGVARISYTVDGGPAQTYSGAFTIADVGRHTIAAWAVDNSGVVEAPRSASFEIERLDGTGPVIEAALAGTLGSGGWYVSNIGISWIVEDPESPVSSRQGCDAVTVTEDTEGKSFTCTATSAGGTTLRTVTVKRDATVPTVRYTGAAETYTVDQNVAITCVASDATSGLASSTCRDIEGGAYTFSAGANAFTATATDNAGNSANASLTFTVNVTTDGVCALVQRWVSDHGVANSMCVKLTQKSYRSLENELQAQSGKKIGKAEAEILLRLITKL